MVVSDIDMDLSKPSETGHGRISGEVKAPSEEGGQSLSGISLNLYRIDEGTNYYPLYSLYGGYYGLYGSYPSAREARRQFTSC